MPSAALEPTSLIRVGVSVPSPPYIWLPLNPWSARALIAAAAVAGSLVRMAIASGLLLPVRPLMVSGEVAAVMGMDW